MMWIQPELKCQLNITGTLGKKIYHANNNNKII